ncbi:MAG: ferritin family protein [Armatimonadia bacterium]
MTNLASFSAAEVYEMAIATERSGHTFYEAVAAAAKSDSVRKMMHYLAEAEQNHEDTFRKLRAGVGAYSAPETYAGEEQEYINALLQSRVMPDEETARRVVAEMTDDLQALDFALGFEKDTILFLYEMREIVPPAEQPQIDKLLQQEKAHVRLLQEFKTNRD